jgi:hypothetical protein
MHIAILGAPDSGKTSLQRALAQHLPGLQISDDPPMTQVQPSHYDLILLTGLDLPECGTPAHHATDARVRALLNQAGLAYGVVYGQGTQRLRAAMHLIAPQDGPPPRWTGVCEKCADPECELRLFTGLTRSTAAARLPS